LFNNFYDRQPPLIPEIWYRNFFSKITFTTANGPQPSAFENVRVYVDRSIGYRSVVVLYYFVPIIIGWTIIVNEQHSGNAQHYRDRPEPGIDTTSLIQSIRLSSISRTHARYRSINAVVVVLSRRIVCRTIGERALIANCELRTPDTNEVVQQVFLTQRQTNIIRSLSSLESFRFVMLGR
jgi:hypothetical protein